MEFVTVGAYTCRDTIMRYKIINIDTGEHIEAYNYDLDRLKDKGHKVQKIWNDYEGLSLEYGDPYIEEDEYFQAYGVALNLRDTFNEQYAGYQYPSNRVLEESWCKYILVGEREEEYILYDILGDAIKRVSRLEMIAVYKYISLRPDGYNINLGNTDDNNKLIMLGGNYKDDNGFIHIVNCGAANNIFVVPSGIKYIREIAISGVSKLIVGNDVIGIGVTYEDNDYLQHKHHNDELKEVTIKGNVDTILDLAFIGCESLEKVKIEKGVRVIGKDAFRWCKSLKEIVIPSSVNYIGACAFTGCENLIKVRLDCKIDKIEYGMFNNCAISEIIIPETVREIGSGAFSGCNSLKEIEIPGTVRKICTNAFSKCRRLEIVKFGEGLNKICTYAFGACTSIRSLEIPKSVREIEYRAFGDCYNLETVKVHRSTKFRPGTFPESTEIIYVEDSEQ